MDPVLLVMLLLHGFCCGYCAFRTSGTLNEPARLAAGLAVWQWGTTAVYRVNPPLIHAFAALPDFLLGARLQPKELLATGAVIRPEHELGRSLMHANREEFHKLILLARLPCIAVSLTGAVACYAFGRRIYGRAAGLAAAGFWCLCPPIIGHAAVIGTDVPAAVTALIAAAAFWRWLNTRLYPDSLLCGMALGVAIATKFSNLALVLAWVGILAAILTVAVINRSGTECLPPGDLMRLGVGPVILFATALVTVNLVYGFSGTFTRLDDYMFCSSRLSGLKTGWIGNRFTETSLGVLPVPLPKDMVQGLDVQLCELEEYPDASYLRGTWKTGGWWYYYCVAACVKSPVGLLIALMCSGCLFAFRPLREVQPLAGGFLFLHALVFLICVSAQLGFNHHFRYAMPMFPFLFILAGRLVSLNRSPVASAIVLACLGLNVVETATSLPHCLSWFNWPSGGSHSGTQWLLHSNIDWGQDLIPLREYLDRRPVAAEPVKLAYYGSIDPAVYGIQNSLTSDDLDRLRAGNPRKGTYAVSVNLVYGARYAIQSSEDTELSFGPETAAWFQSHPPDIRIGNSIYVYHVD